MKTWVRKTLSVGVLAAGALLFAPGAAHADGHQSNGDNNGVLNGTQLVTGVQVPVNVVGNSVGILGEANSLAGGINRIEGTHVGQVNGDNNGIANGTQAYLPITVPLNLDGNAVAVAGAADSVAGAVNDVHSRRAESGHTTEGLWGGNGDGQFNGDNDGLLNGTQIYAPVSVPVNACGNSIALLGGAYSQALCANDVFGGVRFRRESGMVTECAWQSNGDNNGVLNGTQLYAPISLPLNLSGNALGVLGGASSHAFSGNRIESAQGGWDGQFNGDNDGVLNGTQIAAPISVPLNVCGNSLGILGAAGSNAVCGNDVFGRSDIWMDDHHGHRHHRHGGHGGHGVFGGDHGHKGHHAGDPNDPGQYGGDRGDKPDTNGYGQGTQPATNNAGGYGHGTQPATNNAGGYGHGTQPATNNAGAYGHGTQPATNNSSYGHGTQPATNNAGGYGHGTQPATNNAGAYGHGTQPATNSYQGNKDDQNKYGDKDTRGKSQSTEGLPVANLTDTLGGAGDSSGFGALGLLNTLR
jgi:hypothetical protein